ncbi:MAG: VWA domain-containing protein [Acidobacteria bacterium]|nr:VWA domain-containing protein [Acidobacteriota bacterium]
MGWPSVRFFLQLVLLTGVFAGFAGAQSGRTTPRPRASDDDTERVATEEIKLNVSAFDRSGEFFAGVGKDDLVINEDGVLHQPASVRRLPASVLIVLDTGGEDRQAKDFKTTRDAAKALVKSLRPDDTIAILEYNDEARILVEWTNDKDQLITALDKNLKFGRRSRFVDALGLAVDFFDKSKLENRHLVLITDGLDSTSDETARGKAIKKLLATDINVHILSYTKMEQTVVGQRIRSVNGGGTQKKELPPGADIPVQGQTRTYPVMTINLDREMIRKIRERGENLAKSEKALTKLAEDTNGLLVLPDSRQEMIERAGFITKNIDANYVVTYIPKRPLADVRVTEERNIEITSRRSGLDVLAKRKLIVNPQ